MLTIILNLALLFLFSSAMLFSLRKLARHPKINLVDKPNERKCHKGSVPLVGGISIYLSILLFLQNSPDVLPHSNLYLISITLLVAIGVLDDKFDISVKLRMLVQAGLALSMIYLADIQFFELGDMFGFGYIVLPNILGQLLTIFAVIGAINAFNMVDGIDGLLGGLASVSFAALGFLFMMHSLPEFAYFCVVFIIIIFPYIFFNLGYLGRARRVFMGDAGSMLIGFTVVWLLISGTRASLHEDIFRPVTALWIIAIPLMDMVAIMFRRIRRGNSPFKPDREHLHHIFQRIGLNSMQTLLTICSLSIFCASIGVLGEVFNVPESIMFYLFIVFFAIYAALLSNIWKVVKIVRSMPIIQRVFVK